MKLAPHIIGNSIAGAVAGFLTRPCCVIPAAMSVAGVGSAGLAHAAVVYRPALLTVSAVMLASSIWLTFRREGGWLPKALAAGATLAAFALSARFIGLY
jgi:hypothetical protein